MENFEEEDNLHIFCNHNLDTQDVNKLTLQLAEVFKINIEYRVHQNGETLHNTIAGNIASEEISNLIDEEDNGRGYVLEIGEEALFISNEILVYNCVTMESFEELSEDDNLASESYLKTTIEQLKKLGAKKIIFAKENNTIKTLKIAEHTYDQYFAAVKANTKYFTV